MRSLTHLHNAPKFFPPRAFSPVSFELFMRLLQHAVVRFGRRLRTAEREVEGWYSAAAAATGAVVCLVGVMYRLLVRICKYLLRTAQGQLVVSLLLGRL